MIKFSMNKRFPFFIPGPGVVWVDFVINPTDVRIGIDFLERGYKI